MSEQSATGGEHSRRRFLRVAAVGAPAAAVAVAAALREDTASASARAATLDRVGGEFTHRGHHVRITRDGHRVALWIDGRVIPGAVRVRGDGALASPELLPYSDADWDTDAHRLVRRLIDGNGVDYVIF